jgi:hypothetical protein
MKHLGALLLAPIFFACGSDGAGGGGGDGTIPTCGAGQALSTNKSGQIICKDLPTGSFALEKCDATTQAVTDNGKGIFCTARNNGTQDDPNVVKRIDEAQSKINELEKTIGTLTPGTAAAHLYLGNSTATTKGNFLKAGDDNSLVSAAKMCEATFPGKKARMCTVEDIYQSVVKGKITSAMTIPKAWVYMTQLHNPVAGATDPNYAFGSNCASYNYPTADQKWTGVAFSTAKIAYNNQWAVRFHNGLDATTGAPCNATLPVACCGD